MKIIIAPAKIMKIDRDSFPIQSKPQFLDKTRILERFLKSRSNEQLKDLWHASENVTKQSILQLENINLDERLTPAILAFQEFNTNIWRRIYLHNLHLTIFKRICGFYQDFMVCSGLLMVFAHIA